MAITPQSTEVVDAIELLKDDHRRIKNLFERFEGNGDFKEQYDIAKEAIDEIRQHWLVEEEIFYPECRKFVEDQDLVLEAMEAHHVAKVVMTELRFLPAGKRFNAKFRNLKKTVLAHIKEEEDRLFPEVGDSEIDLKRLGEEMSEFRMRGGSVIRQIVRRTSRSPYLAVALAVATTGGLLYAYRRRTQNNAQKRRTYF